MKIDISKKDKAEVLVALYNASHTLGLCHSSLDSNSLTLDEARKLLKHTSDFLYIKGHILKVNLKGDKLETWPYDRENGLGTAAKALSQVKDTLI